MHPVVTSAFYDEMTKISSKIRKAIQMVPKVIDYTATSKPVVRWAARIGKSEIGEIVMKGNQVSWSHIEPEFRGMGLGKKMYGEIMRRMPEQTMVSDDMMSSASRRVWKGMKGRSGYKVETPFLGKRGPEIIPDFKQTLRPQFQASLPEAAAIEPSLKHLPDKVEKIRAARINAAETLLTIAAIPAAIYGNVKMNKYLADKMGKGQETEKAAALKEIVRLLAKDIPGTPRLVMKHRNVAQRAALGESAERLMNRMTDPAMAIAEKGLSRLPAGRVQGAARRSAEMVVRDPLGHGLATLVPIPVLPHAGVEVMKKGIRRGIDAIDPIT